MLLTLIQVVRCMSGFFLVGNVTLVLEFVLSIYEGLGSIPGTPPKCFIFIAEQYSVIWMYHCLYNYSSIVRHYGYFQVITISSKAALSNHIKIFLCMKVLISMWSHCKYMLNFSRSCKTSFQQLYNFDSYQNIWDIQLLREAC